MIERNESPSPEVCGLLDALLHQPVEPIICWIDCHETDPTPVAPLLGTLELVLTLVCCIVLAGFALANLLKTPPPADRRTTHVLISVVSARASGRRHSQSLRKPNRARPPMPYRRNLLNAVRHPLDSVQRAPCSSNFPS